MELGADELLTRSRPPLTAHEPTVAGLLALARARGRLPDRVRVVGLEVSDISAGLTLTEPVAAALPRMVRRATAIVLAWSRGAEAPRPTA